jgi:hypothetical protein
VTAEVEQDTLFPIIRLSVYPNSSHITKFCANHNFYAYPQRLNCTPLFLVFDPTNELLSHSPSPFVRSAWKALLKGYPGLLPSQIDGMITYGCKLGYEGPLERIVATNLSTAQLDPKSMTKMLQDDLQLRRVSKSLSTFPFICSPLGFVPKPNRKLRCIHYLSHPRKSGTNAGIAKDYRYL